MASSRWIGLNGGGKDFIYGCLGDGVEIKEQNVEKVGLDVLKTSVGSAA